MTDTRAFGIDVSRYDGLINWGAVEAHTPEVAFIAFRSTISSGYRDPFFTANWREAGLRGYNRLAYHVVYPGEDATRQADNLFGHIGNDLKPTDRFVLDDEVEHDVSILRHTDTDRKLADVIFRRTLHKPLLYSRTEYLDRRVDLSQLLDLPLWLAQYLKKPFWAKYANEHPGPPTLPRHATTWLVHQTGDKMPPFCATSGKATQDYDRWNGDEAAVNHFFGSENNTHNVFIPIVSTPVPEQPIEQPVSPSGTILNDLLRFEALVDGQSVRSRPSTSGGAADIQRKLAKGDIVTVSNVAGGDSWVEIAPGEWAAVRYGGTEYLRRVG